MQDDSVDLWATDEVHFQQHGSRCRMWIPPEIKDPVLLHAPTRKSVGYFGAVRLRDGRFVFRLETGKFNGPSFLGTQHRRLQARRGPAVAVKAMAAKLARLVYNMLRYGMEYADRGIEFYEQQQRERRLHALAKNAAQLGFQLVPAAS
jgi:hypothetical protein